MALWQLYIRHAHRNKAEAALDNGLSEKGRKQCEALIRYLEDQRPLKKPTRVLSSPKRRCIETAEYVATWSGARLEVALELDEQHDRESDKEFIARISDFREKHLKDSRLCCVSHGDLLPILGRLFGTFVPKVRKGDLFWVLDSQLSGLNDVNSTGNDEEI